MNGHKGVQRLLDINQNHSTLFSSPEEYLRRQQYRAKHPTEIMWFKCMDGRVHGPLITQTPLGIITPQRNLGGIFNLGWAGLMHEVREWVDYVVKGHGNQCLVIISYHFSKGIAHRGCRGFDYDVNKARKFTKGLTEQFQRVFGLGAVYAIQVGVETDTDSLILHGDNDQVLDLSEVTDSSSEALMKTIRKLYPRIPNRTARDLLPLVQGNIAHIAEVKKASRPIEEAEHREWALCIGRGFDWLHEINTAFVVGPFDPDLGKAIGTAAKLLMSNIEEGRNSPHNAVLMTAAPYRKTLGYDPLLATEKAQFLREFSLEAIKNTVPELLEHIETVSGIVDMNTREFKVVQKD